MFYQIYPASFRDANNDGVGDIRGIIEGLPMLSKLGVTVIWISPIYQSPMFDNGYDISDYYKIDSRFGSMNDFDELLTNTKKLGIKIVMDLVVNHTSNQHAWFQEAISDRNSPYRNYYIFKEGDNGREPNNWRSNFGKGSSWTLVPGTQNTFYHHVFSKFQPDLNWENPDLRRSIYKMINWWLKKGVAGFRVDAITFLKKDQDFASIVPDGSDGLGKVKRKSENRPGIEIFLKELNEQTFYKANAVTIGEASGVEYKELGKFIGNDGYFSMIFDFHYADIDVVSGSEWFKKTNWSIKELKNKIFDSQLSIQKYGWGANFLENHDQPRSINKYIKNSHYWNSEGAKSLAVLFFFLRGCPFIFQGQELGMLNANRNSISEFNDISSLDNYDRAIEEGINPDKALQYVNGRSRDNGRTPYLWTRGKNFGFNQGHAPWLPFSNQKIDVNVTDEMNDKNSVWHFYQQLIKLRNSSSYSEKLIYGDFFGLESPDSVIAYTRGEKLGIYVNLSDEKVEIDLPHGEVIVNTIQQYRNDRLEPYQAVMIEEKNND